MSQGPVDLAPDLNVFTEISVTAALFAFWFQQQLDFDDDLDH